MDILKEIHTYTLDLYSGGTNARGYEYQAVIGLQESDGSTIGGIYFHRDVKTMPEHDVQDPSGYVWCHHHWDDYAAILDMLRNETPVFLRYLDSWSMASLTTSPEPIGEGE